jgi:hypothetical protein
MPTAGDNTKNTSVKGINTSEEVIALPPNPNGIGDLTNIGTVWYTINLQSLLRHIIARTLLCYYSN